MVTFQQNCPTGCDAGRMGSLPDGSIPLRFQGGVAAPLVKKIPFLSGADGVVSNFEQNKEATRPFTDHPVCAAEERELLIEARTPLLENGGE